MNFSAPTFARSALRPSPAQLFAEAGLVVDPTEFAAGRADGLAGLKWRLTEADFLDRDARRAALSYMLGYKAGELARRGGADSRGLACGESDRSGGGDGH